MGAVCFNDVNNFFRLNVGFCDAVPSQNANTLRSAKGRFPRPDSFQIVDYNQLAPDTRTDCSGAIRQIKARIGLLAQPEPMRSIIDATQREQWLCSA